METRTLPVYEAGSAEMPFVITGMDEFVDRDTAWAGGSRGFEFRAGRGDLPDHAAQSPGLTGRDRHQLRSERRGGLHDRRVGARWNSGLGVRDRRRRRSGARDLRARLPRRRGGNTTGADRHRDRDRRHARRRDQLHPQNRTPMGTAGSHAVAHRKSQRGVMGPGRPRSGGNADLRAGPAAAVPEPLHAATGGRHRLGTRGPHGTDTDRADCGGRSPCLAHQV